MILSMHSQDTKNIIIIGWATVISGIINYLVHPFAVRMLSTAEFGQFASLLSMINIMWFIMSAGSIITLKLIADHDSHHNFMLYLKHRLIKPLLIVWAMISLIITLLSPWITHELNIMNIRWVVFVGATMLFSFYGIILNAILQSGGWFQSLSFIGIIWAIMRLAAVVISLYLIPWSSTGAVWSTVIASVLWFILMEYIVRRHLKNPATNSHIIEQYNGALIQQVKDKFHSYINLIIITVIIWIITNSDVLIAQHIFSSEDSGTYASVAVIAKFIIFIGLAAETVLLPKLLQSRHKPERSQIWAIILLMIWFWVISLCGWQILWWTILHLLKPWLESHVQLLLWALAINRCILTLSISSKTLVTIYGKWIIWIMGSMSIIRYIISSFQPSLNHYIYSSIGVLGVTSVIMQYLWLSSTSSPYQHEII